MGIITQIKQNFIKYFYKLSQTCLIFIYHETIGGERLDYPFCYSFILTYSLKYGIQRRVCILPHSYCSGLAKDYYHLLFIVHVYKKNSFTNHIPNISCELNK